MSVLVKANSTRAQSFKRGFWKGLGAPVVLFGTYDLEQTDSQDFQPQQLPARKRGSLAGDWRAVGQSLDKACKVG